MASLSGTVQLTTEGSGKLVDNTRFTAASSSDDLFRQRVVLGGDASSSAVMDPISIAAASSDWSYPIRLNAGSTIYIAGAVVVAGSSSYAVGLVYPGSTWPVNILAGGSSINFGSVPAGSSSYSVGQVWQGSTFAVSLISAGSSINVGVVPAGSSSYALGTVWQGSTFATSLIAAGSSISLGMVAAGSSSYQVGTVWIGGGTTANTAGSVALLGGTTANTIGSAALIAGSSGNILGSVTLAAASTSVVHGAVTVSSGVILGAGSTANALGSVAVLAGTTANTVGSVALLAGSSANTIGNVATSTAQTITIRNSMDSTSLATQKFFYTTGFAPPAASTMQSLNQVTNYSSGASGTSFNVAAGKIFRVEYFHFTLYNSSGSNLWCDVALRVDTSTAGATGTDTPAIYRRLAGAAPSSAAIGSAATVDLVDLTIDIPSSGSFGISAVANSSVNGIVVGGFGGVEYTI